MALEKQDFEPGNSQQTDIREKDLLAVIGNSLLKNPQNPNDPRLAFMLLRRAREEAYMSVGAFIEEVGERRVPAEEIKNPQYRHPYFILDYEERTIAANGDQIKLSNTKYKLLRELTLHPDTILTKEELNKRVFGDANIQSKKLKVHMYNLRQELGSLWTNSPIKVNPAEIIKTEKINPTEKALGYRLVVAEPPIIPY